MGHIIDSTYIYGTFFAVIPYVKVTLMITFLSVGLGTILGLLSCVLQQNKVPVLSQLSYLYVLLCRSIPNMVLLYLVYYGLPILFLALEDQTGFICGKALARTYTVRFERHGNAAYRKLAAI